MMLLDTPNGILNINFSAAAAAAATAATATAAAAVAAASSFHVSPPRSRVFVWLRFKNVNTTEKQRRSVVGLHTDEQTADE